MSIHDLKICAGSSDLKSTTKHDVLEEMANLSNYSNHLGLLAFIARRIRDVSFKHELLRAENDFELREAVNTAFC